MGDFTRTKLEVFGSEYDDTLYVMPEGMWEGRGGPNTFAVILERTADRDGKARLIAAAPDLLEACEGLLHCMELAGWEGDFNADRARAAIAKATGAE